MKNLLLLATAILASSYTVEPPENTNNDLADAHLKGKVKSVVTSFYYTHMEQDYAHRSLQVYDENGNKVVDSNYDDIQFRPEFHKFSYNGEGYVTEKRQYGPAIKDGWKTTFTYNTSGNLEEIKSYHSNGRMEERVVYKYDEQGRNTEQLSYAGDGHQDARTILKYNAAGLLTEKTRYSDFFGEMALFEHYTYQANGNISKEEYGPDHKVSTSLSMTQTAFDDHGNCTAFREDYKSHGGTYTTMYKREISYY